MTHDQEAKLLRARLDLELNAGLVLLHMDNDIGYDIETTLFNTEAEALRFVQQIWEVDDLAASHNLGMSFDEYLDTGYFWFTHLKRKPNEHKTDTTIY